MTSFLSALGRAVGTLGFVVMLDGVARAEHVPSRAYTTADGLAHNVVNRIVGDSRGYFWFCTRDLRHELAHLEAADETRAYKLEAAAFRGLVVRGPTHFISRGLAYANELDRRAAASEARSRLRANASRGSEQKEVHVIAAPPPLRQ